MKHSQRKETSNMHLLPDHPVGALCQWLVVGHILGISVATVFSAVTIVFDAYLSQ